MTAPQELIPILEELSQAYPEKQLEAETLQVYLDNLDDIPVYVLKAAVRQHIQSSQWFPRVSELRQAAARLAGTSHFESLPPRPIDRLLLEAQALEDAFYHGRTLEPESWQRLANNFASAGRHYAAEYTLEKLERLKGILEAERK